MSDTKKKKIVFGTSAGIAAIVGVILGEIYKDEGGYVNSRFDRGGETNLGVTKAVAVEAGWKGTMRTFPKQCETTADVCADRIYYENYIERPGYIPFIKAAPAVGEELVNTAVNMGPTRPSKWLQASLNDVCTPKGYTVKLAVDGKLGNNTVNAFTTCQTKMGKIRFCHVMLDALDGKQKGMYDAIVRNNPSQKVFYKGWINHRIGNVDRKKCDIV